MPRRSLVLDHPQQGSIDGAILAARHPWNVIAQQYDLPYSALRRYAHKLLDDGKAQTATPSAMTPVETFERAFGFEPMAHQRAYLEETRPTIVLKGRQVGMTAGAAALAVHVARSQPGSTSVIISPSLRQSSEVTARARLALWEWDEKLKQDSVSLLRTATGSRIISLPGSARGIRGYACALVILDEASWISDESWAAARPLVSATGGRLVAQSTPGLASGWFHELATDTPDGWAFIKVRSDEATTISPDFLAAERASMSPELYSQEYEAEFGTAGAGTPLFDMSRFERLLVDEVPFA